VKNIFLLIIVCCLNTGVVSAQIAAFAGAEGAGALSAGGRGGEVIQVTNLKDSGPGSLRAAISAEGPRIVVFRVGGTLDLQTTLRVENPYITIAGHTAPGGGILINGKGVRGATLVINSHDVIVRFLRIRNGAGGGTEEDDAIGITGGFNIIVDHCSVSWSTDENLSTWAWDHERWGEPKDISWSYNLVAEGILPHSKAMLTGASSGEQADNMTNIDVHHNLFLHHFDRNPFIKHKSGRIVNNIAYNWAGHGLTTNGGGHFDIIKNLFVQGPNFTPGKSVNVVSLVPEEDAASFNDDHCPLSCPHLYVAGNEVKAEQQNTDGDNWNVISADWSSQVSLPEQYKRNNPLPKQPFPITALNTAELASHMIRSVGAHQKLDEYGNLVHNRDAVDSRLIDEYRFDTGQLVTHETDVNGLPKIRTGVPYPDADSDGMSDQWEVEVGLNPRNPDDGNKDRDNDGVSNIEEFLDGKIPR